MTDLTDLKDLKAKLKLLKEGEIYCAGDYCIMKKKDADKFQNLVKSNSTKKELLNFVIKTAKDPKVYNKALEFVNAVRKK